jgi:hypothetical protein
MRRMPRGQAPLLWIAVYLADFILGLFFVVVFLVDFFAVLFFFAAFMLSTRLGYLRPAFLAAFFALAFLAGDSFLDFLPAFFLGFGLSQGAFFDFFATAIPPLKNGNRSIEWGSLLQFDRLDPLPCSGEAVRAAQRSTIKKVSLRLRVAWWTTW